MKNIIKMTYKTLIKFSIIILCLISNFSWADSSASANLLKLLPTDHYLGKPDAKVIIIEYSSTGCPHCAEFHVKIFDELKKNYINTGKVLYIYRDLPSNRPSVLGAMLAHCAGDDQYINYIGVLMNSQASWAYRNDYEVSLTNIAKLGGFSEEKIKACFENKVLMDKIFNNARQATQELGINATPTFFLNGKRYMGKLTYTEFHTLIDNLLSN